MKPRLFSVEEVLVVARYVRALREYLGRLPDEAVSKFPDLVAERERCLRWVYTHGERLSRSRYERVRRAMRDPSIGAKQTPTRAERALMDKKERKSEYIKPWNYTKKELALLKGLPPGSGSVEHIKNTNLGHATGNYK